MTAKSKWRGHEIVAIGPKPTWFYVDTGQLVSDDPNRACNLCGSDTDIDKCLGELPGVLNACCGHGDRNESYIQFNNGVIVRGFMLIEFNKIYREKTTGKLVQVHEKVKVQQPDGSWKKGSAFRSDPDDCTGWTRVLIDVEFVKQFELVNLDKLKNFRIRWK